MPLSITKRSPYAEEIKLLLEELTKSSHIGWISEPGWRAFPITYIATQNNDFVGICALTKLKNWRKIGPFVISEKYQGKGYGKQLLQYVIHENKKTNLYIGSSNPIVGHLAIHFGFQRRDNYFALPAEIRLYLIRYLLDRLNIIFLWDALKKIARGKSGRYLYYLRNST